MANLNEDEKNTLAITRYWFENQKKVRALVTKLVKSFDDEDVARLTGIPVAEVWAYVNVPTKKPATQATEVVDHLEKPETIPYSNSKYIAVAGYINNMISEMGLKSGDRLPVGEELSERFGVSRGTITNAIDHLKKNDVVKAVRGQGIFVV